MKKIVVLLGLLCTLPVSAQLFAPQLLVGDKSTEFAVMWAKNIGENDQITLFNYSFFNVDYDDAYANFSELYQVGIYNLNENFGLGLGGRYSNNEFLPQVAISYQFFTETLYFNIFSAVQYSFLSDQPEYGLFGLLIFTPKINENWNSFNQFMFEPLFNEVGNVLTYLQLRIGLDFKTQFQLGIGANLDFVGKDFDFASNIGLFFRADL